MEPIAGSPSASLSSLALSLHAGDAREREGAAHRLADTGAPALSLLADAAREARVEVRLAALDALGRMAGGVGLPVLGGLLEDPDPRIRVAAFQAVAQAGSPAIPLLGEVLISARAQAEDRERVVHLLARIGGEPAAEVLRAALTDPHPPVQQAAMDAAIRMGDAAAQPLCRSLKDPNPAVRRAAAHALVALHEAAVEPTIRLMRDRQEETRVEAAWVLGMLRDRRSIPVLSAALNDAALEVQQAAVLGLARIHEPGAQEALEGGLRHSNRRVRLWAAEALERRGWSPPDPEWRTRFALATENWPAVVEAGSAAAPAVAALLGDPAPLVRIAAARVLGRIGDRAVIPALERGVQDVHWPARKEALKALAELGWVPRNAEERALLALVRGEWDACAAEGDAAIAPLVTCAVEDLDGLPSAALHNLLRLGPAGLQAVARLLRHGGAETQQLIVPVLEANGSAAAGGLLCDYLDHAPLEQRLPCLRALGGVRDARVAVRLCAELRSNHPEERAAAEESLLRVGAAAVEPLVALLGRGVPPVPALLVHIGPPAVPALCRALQAADRDVRLAAALALGSIGDRSALPALRARVRPWFSDPDGQVRHFCRGAIEAIEHRTASTRDLPLPGQAPSADHLPVPGAAPGEEEGTGDPGPHGA
jgi:HEAT repeat protein